MVADFEAVVGYAMVGLGCEQNSWSSGIGKEFPFRGISYPRKTPDEIITAMGAYHLLRDEELMYDRSAAADKDYIVIEGAELNYTACKECETMPGQYGNSAKNMFDYIAKWANTRF